MTTHKSIPASLVLAALVGLAGLTGCNATYTAEVRNATSLTLQARMMQDRLVDDPIELDAATIPPGAIVVLGPASVPLTDPVKLSVETIRDRGNVPTRVTMSRGTSQYVVEHKGDPSFSALNVRLMDHSSPFRLGASSDSPLDE